MCQDSCGGSKELVQNVHGEFQFIFDNFQFQINIHVYTQKKFCLRGGVLYKKRWYAGLFSLNPLV